MGSKQRIKVNPERQRQRFTREFKLEAVRLLEFGSEQRGRESFLDSSGSIF